MPIKDVQTTSKQHAIPQNIMDVEFKLFGNLTMRQFVYLAVTLGPAYVMFRTMSHPIKWVLILILVVLGVGLAFVPLQDRGLDQWIVNFFKSMYTPAQKVWRKDPTVPSAFTYQNLEVVKRELITLAPTSSRRKLEEYLDHQKTDIEKDPLDIQTEAYVKQVREAFAGSVSTGVTLQEPVFAPPIAPSTPVVTDAQPVPPVQQQEPEMPQKPKKELVHEISKEAKKTKEAPPMPREPEEKVVPKIQAEPAKPASSTPAPPVQKQKPKAKPEPKGEKVTLQPLTPDRHSGRVFTSLLPSSGSLVLPIRGETVLKTSDEEAEIEHDIEEKTVQLKQLMAQIKNDEAFKSGITSSTVSAVPFEEPSQQEIDLEAQEVVEKVRTENERLTQEIEQLKADLETEKATTEPKKKQQLLQKLEQEREKTTKEYATLQSTVEELQAKIKEKDTGHLQMNKQHIATVKPQFAKTKEIANDPNIISGIVKTSQQTPVDSVIVIVKTKKDEPVRAIKTDEKGQFKITTPVTNDIYKIEVDKGKKTGLNFDIVEIEAKGDVIPPIEFVGS